MNEGMLVKKDLRPPLIIALERLATPGGFEGFSFDELVTDGAELTTQLAENFHNPLMVSDLKLATDEAIGISSLYLAKAGNNIPEKMADILREDGLIDTFRHGLGMIYQIASTKEQRQEMISRFKVNMIESWRGSIEYEQLLKLHQLNLDRANFRGALWAKFFGVRSKFDLKKYISFLLSISVLGEIIQKMKMGELLQILEHIPTANFGHKKMLTIAKELEIDLLWKDNPLWREYFLADIDREVAGFVKKAKSRLAKREKAEVFNELMTHYEFEVSTDDFVKLSSKIDFKYLFASLSNNDIVDELKFLSDTKVVDGRDLNPYEEEKARYAVKTLIGRGNLTVNDWRIIMRFDSKLWKGKFAWERLSLRQVISILSDGELDSKEVLVDFHKILKSAKAPESWWESPEALLEELQPFYCDGLSGMQLDFRQIKKKVKKSK